MTALSRYDRLEAEGRFAPEDGAEETPVLLSFGDAALTISRFDETPLDQWPLATLARVADDDAGLTLAPDPAAPERLRVEDRDMVAAIRAVAPGLGLGSRRRRARAPWGRAALAVAALVLGGVYGWPLAIDGIAAAVPPAARGAMGDAALSAFAGDAICETPRARRALDALAGALAARSGSPVRLVLVDLPDWEGPATAAPGGRVALAARLADSPEALAAAAAAALAEPPSLAGTLSAAGPSGLLALLRGRPGAPPLGEAGAAAMRAAPAPAPAAPPPVPPLSPADAAALRAACGD